jgi:hypothetical protein
MRSCINRVDESARDREQPLRGLLQQGAALRLRPVPRHKTRG